MTDAPDLPRKRRRKKRRKPASGLTRRGLVRRRNPGAGRPQARNVLRVTHDNTRFQVHMSPDVVKRLIAMCPLAMTVHEYAPRDDPYRGLRMQFARVVERGIPGFYMRIEPPSYDPTGYRLSRADAGYGAQVRVAVSAKKLGFDPGKLRACVPERVYDADLPPELNGGVLLLLPPEFVAEVPPPPPPREKRRYVRVRPYPVR